MLENLFSKAFIISYITVILRSYTGICRTKITNHGSVIKIPHQCVRCGNMYEDGAQEVLKGCSCGSRFFFFVNKAHMDKMKNMTVDLTNNEREQIEVDVKDMIGDLIEDKSVILDLENIRILKPGHYEISLIDIFKGRPLVYKLEEGKYVIDLASTFESL